MIENNQTYLNSGIFWKLVRLGHVQVAFKELQQHFHLLSLVLDGLNASMHNIIRFQFS